MRTASFVTTLFFACSSSLSFSSTVLGQRPIDQIEHIIIFMQENRAYDHYYGTLQGVRGWNDRTAIPLPNGHSSFYQPVSSETSPTEYYLPFHVDTLTTSAVCMDAPTMNYPTDILIYHEGRYDAWNTAREAGMGMSYFNRTDLPYYYTLYDNFAAGDQYFQATFTQTNPNRLHLFTGSNGLSVGDIAVLDNSEPVPGFTWQTYAEALEDAGISWKVYEEADNFDDNALSWFKNFQQSKPGDPLYDKGQARVPDLIAQLDADMTNGVLPQVTWIVGPANLSEHATYHPFAGEDFTARILKVVESHPDIYAKSVFILNYDEGGQFFDHHFTPTPPASSTDGVSTVTTQGEITAVGLPIGLGFRVPLLIISPWTRGNIVNSQVFDHTSVIRFVAERFNVTCPNISPWRQTVTGNLLSFFDFNNPNYTWPTLPDTSGYVQEANTECETLPAPKIPATQTYPTQELGVRISRALPYEFIVNDQIVNNGKTLTINVANTGGAGAPFKLFDALNGAIAVPRKYAVESSKAITDPLALPTWGTGTPSSPSQYAWALHGPNGFVRQFGGDINSDNQLSLTLASSLYYNVASGSVVINTTNTGKSGSITFTLTDNAYNVSGSPWSIPVNAGASVQTPINMAQSGFWYDFTVTVVSPTTSLPIFQRRFMGRMETGVDTISDPAMGYGVSPKGIDTVKGFENMYPSRSTVSNDHPELPEFARTFKRKVNADHKDAMYKWTIPVLDA